MRPLMSCAVAKLALPMTRLSIMRPAMVAFTAFGSISSLDLPPQAWCRSAARSSRRKSFGNEIVEVAVEHPLRVAFLDPCAQVLDARLVEDVAADLVSPLDVGLGRLELVAVGLELTQFQLVQARFQHRHGFRPVAVLRAIILALYHDARGQMRDAHRGIGLVDVLAAGSRCAVGVDAQVGGIDL